MLWSPMSLAICLESVKGLTTTRLEEKKEEYYERLYDY